MSSFLAQHGSEIVTLTIEHLWLTGASILFASAIGIPTGILLTRYTRLAKPVLTIANIIQTIPSLALFGFLLPVPWLGDRAARIAIVALTGYALLPIIRNTYVGIRGIDPAIIDVAHALGMTGWQRLIKVELPLAAGVILAGLRTATVICVGIATIAAAVGAGGLGEFIFRGVASVDNRLVLAGAIPAALLALGADGLLGWAERRLKRCAVTFALNKRHIGDRLMQHEIWQGTRYEEGVAQQKLFIVGNSHYCDEKDSHSNSFTLDIVHRVKGGERLSFFSGIQKAFGAESPSFWDQVVFFNFLPRCVGPGGDKYKAADPATKKEARRRFHYALGKYAPDKVIAFSNSKGKGWRIFPKTQEEIEGQHLNPIEGFPDYPHFNWGTYHVLGKPIRAFGLRHIQGAEANVLRDAVTKVLAM